MGTATARRYAPGFSPIVGFATPHQPDFEALAPYCELGEHFYCDDWSGPAPDGWQVEFESTMFKLVWEGEMPEVDDVPYAVDLKAEHAEKLFLPTLSVLRSLRRSRIVLRVLKKHMPYKQGERYVSL